MSLGSDKLSDIANISLVVFLTVSVFITFISVGANNYDVEANTSDLEELKGLGLDVANNAQNVGNETTNLDQDPEAKADVEGNIFSQTLTSVLGFVTSIISISTNMMTNLFSMIPLGAFQNPLIIVSGAAFIFFMIFRVIVPLVIRR